MQYSSLPDFTHPELLLRPITADDLPLWANYLRDPAVFQHTSWNLQSERELDQYIWNPASITPDSTLRLAIASRVDNRLVGSIGLHWVSDLHKSAELAYDLSPAYWGRRIIPQAAQTMMHWAHEKANVTRLQATVLQSNKASIAVIERCGFQREGLLRSYRQVRGTPGDFWMYSHLAGDDVR